MTVGGLEFGVVGACLVCRHATGWWLRGKDRYHPVHRAAVCLDRLGETLAELETVEVAASALAAGPRRGAWARRGLGAATTSATSIRHGLPKGSPFHVPGMPDDAPWAALVETNHGQRVTLSSTGDAHPRRVLRDWRLLTGKGYEISPGGVYAVGGVLVDPTGAVSDAWGDPPVIGAPRWRAITHVSHWTTCARCDDVLWPGCLIAVEARTCVTCTAADEHDDPRVWPDEPARPAHAWWPERFGGPKRPKVKTKSTEGS